MTAKVSSTSPTSGCSTAPASCSTPASYDEPDELRDAIADDTTLVVTDSNRRRARRWTSVRDNRRRDRASRTKTPLVDDPGDARLEVFPSDDRRNAVDDGPARRCVGDRDAATATRSPTRPRTRPHARSTATSTPRGGPRAFGPAIGQRIHARARRRRSPTEQRQPRPAARRMRAIGSSRRSCCASTAAMRSRRSSTRRRAPPTGQTSRSRARVPDARDRDHRSQRRLGAAARERERRRLRRGSSARCGRERRRTRRAKSCACRPICSTRSGPTTRASAGGADEPRPHRSDSAAARSRARVIAREFTLPSARCVRAHR